MLCVVGCTPEYLSVIMMVGHSRDEGEAMNVLCNFCTYHACHTTVWTLPYLYVRCFKCEVSNMAVVLCPFLFRSIDDDFARGFQ